jgi:hypothetical protein
LGETKALAVQLLCPIEVAGVEGEIAEAVHARFLTVPSGTPSNSEMAD